MSYEIISVHPHTGFVPEEEFLEGLAEIEPCVESINCLSHSYRDEVVGEEFYDIICDDANGNAKMPRSLMEMMEPDSKKLFVGGKASECVPKAAISYVKSSGDFEIYAEPDLIYEPKGESYRTVGDIPEDEFPSLFSDAGFEIEKVI